MRILRTVILSIGLAAVATACGGKSKSEPTTTENTGGDMGATGGDTYGAADTGTGGDMGGGEGGGDMGGGGEDPCAGGE
jgi:hypothetical protein